MDFSKILSISGKSGLFQVVSQLKNAVLVESLIDKKRFPAFAHDKISSLQEISIFTTSEDKPLKEVLKAIHEKLEGKVIPETKSDTKVMTSFFLEVVPDYDTQRVYTSDIKKILNWYNLLLENNLLDFSEKEEDKQDGSITEPEVSKEIKDTVEKKKKTTPKKSENLGKQSKPTSSRSVKKSEHRSMNSK